jgi:hypothetical protein
MYHIFTDPIIIRGEEDWEKGDVDCGDANKHSHFFVRKEIKKRKALK